MFVSSDRGLWCELCKFFTVFRTHQYTFDVTVTVYSFDDMSNYSNIFFKYLTYGYFTSQLYCICRVPFRFIFILILRHPKGILWYSNEMMKSDLPLFLYFDIYDLLFCMRVLHQYMCCVAYHMLDFWSVAMSWNFYLIVLSSIFWQIELI